MNGADSRGRGDKCLRINEKDCDARVRETSEEREARLTRRRQRPVILLETYTVIKQIQILSVLLTLSHQLARFVRPT